MTASYSRSGRLRWLALPDTVPPADRPEDIVVLEDSTVAFTGTTSGALEDVFTLRYRQP